MFSLFTIYINRAVQNGSIIMSPFVGILVSITFIAMSISNLDKLSQHCSSGAYYFKQADGTWSLQKPSPGSVAVYMNESEISSSAVQPPPGSLSVDSFSVGCAGGTVVDVKPVTSHPMSLRKRPAHLTVPVADDIGYPDPEWATLPAASKPEIVCEFMPSKLGSLPKHMAASEPALKTERDVEVAEREIRQLEIQVQKDAATNTATDIVMEKVKELHAAGKEVVTVGNVYDAIFEDRLDIRPVLNAKIEEVETYKEFAESEALHCSTFLKEKETYFKTGYFSKVLGLKSECCVLMLHFLRFCFSEKGENVNIYVRDDGTLLYGVLTVMKEEIIEISSGLLQDIPDTKVIKASYGQPFGGCWLSWAVTHFEAPYLENTSDILQRGTCRHPLYPGVLVDPLDGTEVDENGTKKIFVKGNVAKTEVPSLPTLYGGLDNGFDLHDSVAQTFYREAKLFLLRVTARPCKRISPNVCVSVMLSKIDADHPQKYVIQECHYQLTDLAERRGLILTLPKTNSNIVFTFGLNQVRKDGSTYPSQVMFKSGPFDQMQFAQAVFQQIEAQEYLNVLYNHANATFYRALIIIGGEWSLSIDIGCDVQKRVIEQTDGEDEGDTSDMESSDDDNDDDCMSLAPDTKGENAAKLAEFLGIDNLDLDKVDKDVKRRCITT